MINALVIAVFGAAFVVEYLIRERDLLHPYLILLPELMSAIAPSISPGLGATVSTGVAGVDGVARSDGIVVGVGTSAIG